ncbi:Uncharacterised protein [Candidatus Gugararchaeum adminiculabundum]|nr:Uncharacterised protein [Candidatus Gugararchaeum adminiculabundum]
MAETEPYFRLIVPAGEGVTTGEIANAVVELLNVGSGGKIIPGSEALNFHETGISCIFETKDIPNVGTIWIEVSDPENDGSVKVQVAGVYQKKEYKLLKEKVPLKEVVDLISGILPLENIMAEIAPKPLELAVPKNLMKSLKEDDTRLGWTIIGILRQSQIKTSTKIEYDDKCRVIIKFDETEIPGVKEFWLRAAVEKDGSAKVTLLDITSTSSSIVKTKVDEIIRQALWIKIGKLLAPGNIRAEIAKQKTEAQNTGKTTQIKT